MNMLDDIQRKNDLLKNLYTRRLPDKAMELAQEIINQNFEQEQYTTPSGTGKWASRSDKYADKKRTERRALLVDSGDLLRSINVYLQGSNVVISSDRQAGKWNLAQIHNEGLEPQEKRQFMPIPGESFDQLITQLDKWLDEETDKIMNS